jgi:outer membrane protein
MNNKVALLALLASAAVASVAHAQSAGTWSVRAGVTNISPDVNSGNLSAPSLPGSKTDVKSASQVTGGVTYMYTDHFAVDLPLSLPFRHDLVGAGAIAGVGKIGDVKVLPITVFGQYRFLEAQAQFRPYVGLGVTYANFFAERGSGVLTGLTNPGGTPTRLSIDDRWGLTPQLGLVGRINERWFFDVSVAKTYLKTRNTLSTGQTLDIKLDPVSVSLGVGMRF